MNITLPGHEIAADDLSRMTTMFNESHHIQYGHSMDDPIELVTLRLRAVGLLPRPHLPKIASGTGSVEVARKGERPVYRPGSNQNEYQVNYAVYDRLKLRRANQIAASVHHRGADVNHDPPYRRYNDGWGVWRISADHWGIVLIRTGERYADGRSYYG